MYPLVQSQPEDYGGVLVSFIANLTQLRVI